MCYSGRCKFENFMGDCRFPRQINRICYPNDIEYEKILNQLNNYKLQKERKEKLIKINEFKENFNWL